MPTEPAGSPRYRIWALECPFKKSGVPVVGSFGATVRPVIVIETKTWLRMCEEIPALGTTKFEVGSYE